MKKILVPTDFSTTAGHAFKLACDIAVLTKGEIYLLNIIEFPKLNGALPVPVQAYEQLYLKNLKEKAYKAVEKFKSTWGKKTRVHFSMEHGTISRVVQKFAERKKIDLIVIGTHGSSGVADYFVGSNAEKIVQTATIPVIAVKRPYNLSLVKHLIFPTNLRPAQSKLIANVKELQNLLKAKLDIVFINTPGNFRRDVFIERRLNEFVRENQLRNFSLNIFNDIDEEEGIINFSTRFKNAMIVISTHGRKGLNHLFSGSIAEDVVNHIQCPVWTFVSK